MEKSECLASCRTTMFIEGHVASGNFSGFLAKGICKWECLQTLLLDRSNSSVWKSDFLLGLMRDECVAWQPPCLRSGYGEKKKYRPLDNYG